MTEQPIDLLAIAAHPDDAELLCGGTLLRAAAQGYRTAILDLTAGETGTYGDADTRSAEAREAARILGLAGRFNAGLPDAALENTPATRAIVAGFIRAPSSSTAPPPATRTTARPASSATTPASSPASAVRPSRASPTGRPR